MNSREDFVNRAVRNAEKRVCVPAGWWGVYRHVRGPNGVEVRRNRAGGWVLRQHGKLISKHDSRWFAINKARRLAGDQS